MYYNCIITVITLSEYAEFLALYILLNMCYYIVFHLGTIPKLPLKPILSRADCIGISTGGTIMVNQYYRAINDKQHSLSNYTRYH